ncbi:hypothetical protein [Niabella hibiscisoli]|uniref:hypothetical protein n=1 Tax=Niabella hibiscisoli TaxID=1825928 RepID=UPI001F0F992F|nr:hypothetical protein [Niabella hibiscisoli]MCH5714830.1 hypothetical protein [Niabella hibiscisoli]
MSLLNQNNKKGKKDNKSKDNNKQGSNSKFIQKPQGAFVSKQQNTGSQRGS